MTTHSFDPVVGRAFVDRLAGEPRRRFPCPRAFSLVELLVTMAVTLLLVLVLLQIFSGASNTWRHSEEQVDAYREARGALQLMARDLAGTVQASYAQPGGGAVNNAGTTDPLMPTLVLQHYASFAGTTASNGGPTNEEVYCLTNIPNQGAGTLCAVGYFCQWMPSFVPPSSDGVDRVPRAYALMRQSLDSNGTFLRIQAANAGTSPLSFLGIFSRTGTPSASIAQVAAYIWDLRFRIDTDLNETTHADGNSTDAPVDHSSPQRIYGGDTKSTGPYPPRLPSYVEIRFRALSDLAGRRLEGATSVIESTWNDAAGFAPQPAYTQIIRPNYQQFVLRVPLGHTNP